MTVLVTGANGFIGRHLIKKLYSYRQTFGEIITTSRRHFKSPYSYQHYRCDLGFSDTTEAQFSCLRYMFKKHEPSYIFHLASKATVKMEGNDPFGIIQDNILSTQKICQWAPKGARVVLASSVIVYGDWSDLYIEEDKTEPTSIYGMTKRASESILNYNTDTLQWEGGVFSEADQISQAFYDRAIEIGLTEDQAIAIQRNNRNAYIDTWMEGT